MPDSTADAPAPPKWFEALPAPKSSPQRISCTELHELMVGKQAGIDYVVVDVRRADIEAPLGFVHPSAINLPAQTLYQTLEVVHAALSRVPLVIFHCSSSNGRGPRCAAWYQDHVDQFGGRGGVDTRAVILDGGIKAWAAAYPELVVRVQS